MCLRSLGHCMVQYALILTDKGVEVIEPVWDRNK